MNAAMKFRPLPRLMERLAVILAVAAIYYGAGRLGQLVAIQPGNVTAVWPASGLALAAVLLLGKRVWPGIWLGAFVVNTWAFFDNTNASSVGVSLAVGSGISAGATLEALAGAYLLGRFVGPVNPLERSRDVLKFVVLAGAVSCLTSATIGVTSLCLGGFAHWTAYGYIWSTWWLGDTIGVLVVTPMLLAWSQPPQISHDPRQLTEAALLIILLFAVSELVFGGWFAGVLTGYPLAYAVIPFLVWAAFRFGPKGATLTILLTSGIATWGTVHGSGLFQSGNLNESLILLQTYMSVVTVTALVLAAVVSERAQAEEEIKKLNEELENRVSERTAQLEATNRELEREVTERKRTEEMLHKNYSILRAVTEGTTEAIFVKDLQGRYLMINSVGARFLGKSVEEVIGRDDTELFSPDTARQIMEGDRRVIARGETQTYEDIGTAAGVTRTYLSTKGVFRDQEGKIIGLIGIARDITERKRADDALRQLAAIVTSSEDAIISKTLDGIITSWNTGAERTYGYQAEEVVGKSISLLILPDHADELPAILEKLRRGERIQQHEVVRVKKDGEQIDIALTISPIKDDTGKITGASTIARDITERKQAEKRRARRAHLTALRAEIGVALAQSGNLQSILQSCTEAITRQLNAAFAGIWTLNREESMLELEASAGLNTHSNDLHARVPVGAFKIGLIAQERQPHLTNDILNDPRLGNRDWAKQEGMVAFAGYPLLVEDRLVGVTAMFAREPLPDDILDALASITDVIAQGIERKRAEEALKQQAQELARSNAELEQFAYVASHDLQEPLRMVASYTQLLAKRYQGKLGADADDFIFYAVDGANRMQKLINDLLAYSRVGTRGKEFEPVNCCQVLEQALNNLQVTIKGCGAQVTHDPLPTVMADPTQMIQLFQNLIGNAIKFHGEEPPRVHVSVQSKADEWVFSVCDNGIGIDPQYYERIFVIFQRLHGKQEYSGTGIGLAICKKIVERHGGRLWVESPPGSGATFYFSLRRNK